MEEKFLSYYSSNYTYTRAIIENFQTKAHFLEYLNTSKSLFWIYYLDQSYFEKILSIDKILKQLIRNLVYKMLHIYVRFENVRISLYCNNAHSKCFLFFVSMIQPLM